MNRFAKYSNECALNLLKQNFILDGLFNFWGTQAQNKSNEKIAKENLEYQKERNVIEDARYEDEMAYNRAFAEDERSYSRALQQQIFDREDTALERQAESLSKMGINPLSQNMQGLGAGQAVAASPAPATSTRGGTALHNDMKYENELNDIAPIMSLINGIDNLNTQGLQRDSLREQNDYQRLINQEKTIELGFKEEELKDLQEGRKTSNKNAKSTAERNERENKFQEKYGVTDNTNTYARIATDVANQAERAGNYLQQKTVESIESGIIKQLANSAKDKISDYGNSLKQGWENDKKRASNTWNRIKNWYKDQKYKSTQFWSTNK